MFVKTFFVSVISLALSIPVEAQIQRPDALMTSVDNQGFGGNNESIPYGVSENGVWALFTSFATNLIPNDTNQSDDVFLFNQITRSTQRVNISNTGQQASPLGFDYVTASMAADATKVVFDSSAPNLVTNDLNQKRDIFLRDILSNQTHRLSVSTSGAEANGDSFLPRISPDGNFVVFESLASNLVPGDTNNSRDIFVRDIQNGTTSRISLNSAGVQGNGGSFRPAISGFGRFVTFDSLATNLIGNDTNGQSDVFVRDLRKNLTVRVSTDSNGQEAGNFSYYPDISTDGRFVSFNSWASNLVANDTNGTLDIFVKDRKTNQTIRANVSSQGVQGNAPNGTTAFLYREPSLSGDGRYVTFFTQDSNIVPGTPAFPLSPRVYVHEIGPRITSWESLNAQNQNGSTWSLYPQFSLDGNFISFWAYVGSGLLAPGQVLNHHSNSHIRNRANILAYTKYLDGNCGGLPRIPHLGASPPVIAQNLTFYGEDSPTNSIGLIFFSLPVAAPIDLGANCKVHLDLAQMVFLTSVTSDGLGDWTLSIPVPSDPTWTGLKISIQAIFLNTNGPLGFDLTNGITATFGQ